MPDAIVKTVPENPAEKNFVPSLIHMVILGAVEDAPDAKAYYSIGKPGGDNADGDAQVKVDPAMLKRWEETEKAVAVMQLEMEMAFNARPLY